MIISGHISLLLDFPLDKYIFHQARGPELGEKKTFFTSGLVTAL